MRQKKNKLKMIVEKTNTGFSAFCEEQPIYTTGESVAELINNAHEAVQLYLEDETHKVAPGDIRFEIDFQQFFSYYKVLNASFLAEKIGMHPTLLSQYIKGHKKPSEKQTRKILEGIHQIGRELAEINLIYLKNDNVQVMPDQAK
jgi:predicted RNase H-like HicB family nuclease